MDNHRCRGLQIVIFFIFTYSAVCIFQSLEQSQQPSFESPKMKFVPLLARAMKPQISWRKNDVLDALFYVRSLFALIFGLTLGALKIEGLYPFLTFLALNIALPSMWMRYQAIDEELLHSPADDDSGAQQQPIGMEGFGPSVSLFVLCWVLSYNLVL